MLPIQNLILSELEILVQKSKSFESVAHNSTKGGLRENLLINFFKKLIPDTLDVTAGIICDAKGRTSNQSDFIIYDKSILPRILLDHNVSIIPIETVYLVAEIKTTLRTTDLEQIKTAQEKLSNLELAAIDNSPFKVPIVIIAFDTNVAENTLINWMNQTSNVISICIIGKFTLSKAGHDIETYKKKNDNVNHIETLIFYQQLYDYLKNTIETRKIDPIWQAYILGVNSFNGIP